MKGSSPSTTDREPERGTTIASARSTERESGMGCSANKVGRSAHPINARPDSDTTESSTVGQ